MSATKSVKKPAALRSNSSVEAALFEQKIWRRCNVENLHFMAAVVGREGSGKSHTGLKLAETNDPQFSADQVMFDPADFLERLREWKAAGETKGKMVVADEAGVGLGVRTWYQKDQILFNQVLQVIRDENMGIIFTLPRLNELDSQARGRLHAYLEMTDKEDGKWAEFKWLNWKPTRDERDKIYRKYPTLAIDGQLRDVERLRVSPPSDELVEAYEERKNDFQTELYGEALDEMEEETDDEKTVKEIAVEVSDGGIGAVVSRHPQNKQPYINEELIRAEYELSHRDAKAVKSLLNKQYDKEQLEDYT